MAPSAKLLAFWRPVVSVLTASSVQTVFFSHLQGGDLRVLPFVLSLVITAHSFIILIPALGIPIPSEFNSLMSLRNTWLLVDVVLCLAEAGVFIYQAFTIKWSIQDSASLYEAIFSVVTAFWIIISACMTVVWYWIRLKDRSDVTGDIRLRGENPCMTGIRVYTTIYLIFLMVSFFLTNVVVDPLREGSLLPVKETHSLVFPSNLWVDSCRETSRYSCKPPPTGTFMNVIVTRPSISALGDEKNIEMFPAVKVATFGDGKRDPSVSSCDLVRQATRQVKGKQISVNITWNVLSFGCTYNGIQPQLLITVNFTQLDVNSDLSFPFVHVMIGNTNVTDEVIRMTEIPVVILPGENVVGFAKQHVLQRIKSPISSTLGLSNLYDNIILSEVVQLRPDPQASRSPLIIPSPDSATIRIIPFINIGDWKVIQEYRDKSALKGLSSVGGLWTFFVNCFALLFGISIMRSLFGSKPLSIFGIVHSMPGLIRQGDWRKEYQIGTKEKRNVEALVEFMVDHIVDVHYIQPDTKPVAGDEEKDLSRNTMPSSSRDVASPSSE